MVRSARRFVSDLLLGSALREDAVIVLSELFTNAILHTESGKPGGLVTVQVSRWRLGARVAVTDQGSAAEPVICEAPAAAGPVPNGRGLLLVSTLATHFSWHDDVSGRTACAILGESAGPRPVQAAQPGTTC